MLELLPTHEAYVQRVRLADTSAESRGVILAERRAEYITEAEEAAIPG
jgi:hypothetical protein